MITGQYKALITEYLKFKNSLIKILKKGTIVQKKSKWKTSSTYYCKESPKWKRPLLPTRQSEELKNIIRKTQSALNPY